MMENRTAGVRGKVVSVPSADELTAYLTIADEYAIHGTTTGTVLITWATGDTCKVRSEWMRGQADEQNHNSYSPYPTGSIYRNNVYLEGSSSNMKLTRYPAEVSDPGPPYTYGQIKIVGNYFAGTRTDISADLNNDSRDWVARFKDSCIMDNVHTKNGYISMGYTDEGDAYNLHFWQDSVIGNNILTTFPATTICFGMVLAYIEDGMIVSRNKLVDLGVASGTNIGQNRAPIAVTDSSHTKVIDFCKNDIQMQTTDHIAIGGAPIDQTLTFSGNHYYCARGGDDWFEFKDDVRKTEAEWVAQYTDTGYTMTPITYTSKQTHEGYMTSIGEGTTTIEQLATAYRNMLLNETWSTDFSKYGAPYICRNFRDNYTA
jgi:hypothetical protein